MSDLDLTFNAIDVETANSDRASICQIGIIHVIDGNIVDEWQTLVNPEDWFDPLNIRIHGIGEDTVKNSPTMPDIRAELRRRLRGQILVSHTSFDRVAFERAMYKYDLEQLQVRWLDSAQIVRRTWDQYFKSGYGLKNVAYDLGIEFRHHNALEDARTAAEVTMLACKEKGKGVDDWIVELRKPSYRRRTFSAVERKEAVKIEPNEEGHLYGETLVFTGSLSIPRANASEIASNAGCKVVGAVSRKCTLLVVGLPNRQLSSSYTKSTKHRKAEELIEDGNSIQIISETDFFDLVKIG